ncbi:MAG: biotin synthase BioB [Thermodesulfobacteriota bacterium]
MKAPYSTENIAASSTRELMATALEVKLANRQDSFSLCSIINAKSGACSEDCRFCTQSAHFATETPVYPLLDSDEIVAAAQEAKENGASRFSLVTSGRGASAQEVGELAKRIVAIRNQVDIKVCGSFGILAADQLAILQEAGMDRYHHNLESSKEFFPSICRSHTFADRLNTIKAAQSLGISVCSGGIIGLGESEADRVSMATTLAELEVDSVPLNFLIPLPGTPLADLKALNVEEILRAIALFRLLLPAVPLRLAAGRESALGDFLSAAFLAGADAMMIGGYLTQRGRTPEQDLQFVSRMQALWTR